jgi:hypothetical protein
MTTDTKHTRIPVHELHIHSFVLYDSIPRRVVGLEFPDFVKLLLPTGHEPVNPKEIFGVELSEKVMVSQGFTKQPCGDQFEWTINDWGIMQDQQGKFYLYEKPDVTLQYFHELQNAYLVNTKNQLLVK